FVSSTTTFQLASQTIGYLVQPVLLQAGCLGTDQPVVREVDGIGIPDMIEVKVAACRAEAELAARNPKSGPTDDPISTPTQSRRTVQDAAVWLTAADIKAGPAPR